MYLYKMEYTENTFSILIKHLQVKEASRSITNFCVFLRRVHSGGLNSDPYCLFILMSSVEDIFSDLVYSLALTSGLKAERKSRDKSKLHKLDYSY